MKNIKIARDILSFIGCIVFAVFAFSSYTDRQRTHDLTEACRKQGGMLVDNTCVKERHYGHEASETGPRK